MDHMPQLLSILTPATFKTLELFLANPYADFHEREVMRRARISKGSANRTLRRLASLDLLGRVVRGRMAFYRLNADDPFIKQAKVLLNVGGVNGLVHSLRKIATRIVLFGSCAEGTDTPESDIDILIVAEEKKHAMVQVRSFNRSSARPVSPIIVNTEEFTRLKREDRPLFERIEKGVVLWEAA